MTIKRPWGGLASLPLIVQLFGVLIGALIGAQLVALFLTLILPPAPPQQYALGDIAAALQGKQGSADFDHAQQGAAPDVSGPGWFVSATSRQQLAALLGVPESEVVLGFYTQLPVVGTVEPVRAPAMLPQDATRISGAWGEAETSSATLLRIVDPFAEGGTSEFQDTPGGRPGGGFPGGGTPGGGPGPGMPGGGFPRSFPQQGPPPSIRHPGQPGPQVPRPQTQQPDRHRPDPSRQPGEQQRPNEQGPGRPVLGGREFPQQGPPVVLPGNPVLQPPVMPSDVLPRVQLPPQEPRQREQAVQATPTPAAPVVTHVPDAPVAHEAAPVAEAPVASPTVTDAPAAQGAAPRVSDVPAAVTPQPVAPRRAASGLFGLSSSPFVEGDFVAAARMADGRWAVVMPRAEGFPNAWQRRVGLWFLLSLLLVAPIALLFARRIVGPLADFARAADLLGRDPGAAVLPLGGPAEIGRAAHAFNQMQSRLRAFVDDRTAMIGAISHDLRTPLTRLRFRIEDVPDDQREELLGEVLEMESMITSVIAFMRDANTPNVRERRDLAELVDDVVENAVFVGGDIKAVEMQTAMVDIDALGVRRILDNLLVNAIKYGGGSARVKLHVADACAVADIVDSGPGIPDSEIERVFDPFYRSESAVQSGREGSGLGLAVCRSIARAHGGDVELFRSTEGFTARVKLPLAYGWEREAA